MPLFYTAIPVLQEDFCQKGLTKPPFQTMSLFTSPPMLPFSAVAVSLFRKGKKSVRSHTSEASVPPTKPQNGALMLMMVMPEKVIRNEKSAPTLNRDEKLA